MSSQGPFVKINENLVVNWVFAVSRVHRITAAEKAASNDVNFREAEVGDVVIKFMDGGGVRIAKGEGADEFMAYMHDVADTLAQRRQAKQEAAEAEADSGNRSFGDRFSG